MADVLIVYGTSYGQTAKLARRIADRLGQAGHRVSVWRGDARPSEQTLEDYDAAVVAGSVRFGRHQGYVGDFVRRHLTRLNAMPSAFVSVCGVLVSGGPLGDLEARKYEQGFLARTGWHPELARSFAGGLPYTQYGWPTRWVMRWISGRTGRPTDTSRDWEFTDWDAVDQFADQVNRVVEASATRGVEPSPAVAV